MTATLVLTTSFFGVSVAGGVWATNSTPPNMVMSVAKEPLFRKSRRLTPRESFSNGLVILTKSLSPAERLPAFTGDWAYISERFREILASVQSLVCAMLLWLCTALCHAPGPFYTPEYGFFLCLA